jgi:hypothetical protein
MVSALLLGCTSAITKGPNENVLTEFKGKEKVIVTINAFDSNGTPIFEGLFQVEKGKNALELMKEKMEVETKEFSFGEFVESINGVKPVEGKEYWALYVNGDYSNVGISMIELFEDTNIEWRIEKIE